jgi:hypothetical protein
LCSSLFGLALLLGELVLELLLLGSRRLSDLFELLLKLSDPLILRRHILQQVSPALSQVNQTVNKTTSSSATLQ